METKLSETDEESEDEAASVENDEDKVDCETDGESEAVSVETDTSYRLIIGSSA